MWWNLLSSALLGAFIGWITNVMTIRLLFRPRRPLRLGPVTFQGVIPRRRDDIARALAATVVRHLLSADEIWRALDTAENREALTAAVRRATRARLERLPPFPFRAQVVERIEDAVVRETVATVENWARNPEAPRDLWQRVPLEALIVAKVQALDLADFERVVIGVSHRELRQIELLGGILGFVVGLFLPLVQALSRVR
jgi:uncharacterized membrane protein YheB (UPF0754 family)